jgi:hypothetical protein
VLVREVWPDIESDQIGSVSFSIAARQHPQGAQEMYGPFSLAPNQEICDIGKAAGRLFQLTYSGYSLPSYARVGRLVVDAKQRGRRG